MKPNPIVLVIDDEAAIRRLLRSALEPQNYQVREAETGQLGLQEAVGCRPDVVILDLGLPDMDGFEVLRSLRSAKLDMPILMLTARDAIEDRVHGLGLGADDYLIKPFALTELVARIQALTRRLHTRQHNEILLGNLRIDLTAKRAFMADVPVDFLPREWAVLVYFLNHAGKVVSKEQILEAISGWDDAPSGNAIEVYVSRLRSKLAPAGISIRTIRGFGYLVEELNGIQP